LTALGSRKWDVDGHEYVDYWMGHGALILGHCHPAVVEAVQRRWRHRRLSELEAQWGQWVQT
jgi:glutamate-1-semialdehyde 2,1-aminomutase